VVRDLHRGQQRRAKRPTAPDGVWSSNDAMQTGTTMKLRTCLVGILMMTSTLRAGVAEKLTMRVTPAVAFAPANLIVRAMIVADVENRAVEIIAESNDYYRASEVQLDGENAPRTSTFEFRSLPPGNYAVKARLLDSSGHARASTSTQVNVISSGARDR
jgi:hypothetical protein